MHMKGADNNRQGKWLNMGITENGFLEAANKFADDEHRMGIWEFWAKYDTRSREDGQRYLLAVEPDESERRELCTKSGVYWPLVENPDLFLEFARLADDGGLDNAPTRDELDTDKNRDVALDWAREHGTLGLTRVGPDEFGFRGASTLGGEDDTVAAFAHEAWAANGCLRLYEAATAEELDVDLIASYMTPRGKARYTQLPAKARSSALDEVAFQTQVRIAGNAYPALYGRVGRLAAGWSFTNLLGAMWLQMFWLQTATEVPQRCKNCDKIIAYEQPDQLMQGTKRNDRSAGYRTRRDKRFCDKTCRDRYHYLTVTKPRRQATRKA
jgi:hypothetical protein